MISPEIPEPKPRNAWKTMGRAVVVLGCLSVLFAIFFPADNPERKVPRHPCKNNLKQIGLALHNYHDAYDSFPPAFVLGPDGKRWHSWRALILPFLEEKPVLSKKYRFDEPWNGPNNSKLLDQRPLVFACHWIDNKTHVPKTDTNYVAVVGSDTAWPGAESMRVADIKDGTSVTALVIEVRDAGISWLAPDDLTFEEASLPPRGVKGRRASSIHFTEVDHGGLNVLMGDATVRFVNYDLMPEIWTGILTRAGGEMISDF